MIDVAKLRQSKGRRIYLFWLDEKTGDITDVTSRDDVRQVILCKDCIKKSLCMMHRETNDDYGYCLWAKRREE